MTKFSSETAWVFASLGTQEEEPQGRDLCALIMAADMLNHAIPTRGEIADACSLLCRCGLVQIRDDRMLVTEAGRVIAAEGFARRGVAAGVRTRRIPAASASASAPPPPPEKKGRNGGGW